MSTDFGLAVADKCRKQYATFCNKLSYHRKKIIEKCGIEFKFTFKVSRHTWTSLARKINIPYDVIKACLGHRNSDITSVYLAYDDEQLDEANRKVLNLLNQNF